MTSNSGLERSLALLWQEQTPGRRGPRARLTVERIARAGIEVADTEGLDALSMQRVAAWLGYSTMSLYNHVPGKDLLLEVMADTAAGDPPDLDGFEDRRAAVLHWATQLWAAFHAHPWVLRIPLDHAPVGPRQLAWLDRLLRPLLDRGLPPREAMAGALQIIASLRGAAQVDTDIARGHRGEEAAQAATSQTARLMAGFVDPVRFPALAEVHTAGAVFGPATHLSEPTDVPPGENSGVDDTLPVHVRFGLERLLDGLDSWVR